MKKKTRKVQSPDLPDHLETLVIKELADYDSYEMSRIESIPGLAKAEHVQFSEIHIKNVHFNEVQLPFSSCLDVIFEKCDLSNVNFHGARFNRVEFRECKMIGTDFDKAVMRDVKWIDCLASYSLYNLAELRDVRFDHCLLKGSNFIDARVDNFQLGTSTIQDVQFTGTSLKDVDISKCQFTYLHADEDDLRGAIISPDQAVSFIELYGLKVKND